MCMFAWHVSINTECSFYFFQICSTKKKGVTEKLRFATVTVNQMNPKLNDFVKIFSSNSLHQL